jgi:hypothetical protein
MKGQRQLDDGVPADETTLPGRHLFAQHPTVATAEEVDQAFRCDGLRTKGGGVVERGALRVKQMLEPRHSVVIISFSGWQGRLGHESVARRQLAPGGCG